jgi:hypothetical protein
MYDVLPMEMGLKIVGAFRMAHIPGNYDWQMTFPKLSTFTQFNPILSLGYPQFSSIVWALFNSVNDDRLPYADRKSAYATLGELAGNFGVILPSFRIPGYPNVSVEECR